MDISSVSAVHPPTSAATELIYVLKVIRSGSSSIPYHHLPVLAHKTNCSGGLVDHDAFFCGGGGAGGGGVLMGGQSPFLSVSSLPIMRMP